MPHSHPLQLSLVVVAATTTVVAIACGGDSLNREGPTAPSQPAQTSAASAATTGPATHPIQPTLRQDTAASAGPVAQDVRFPPRQDPFDFRNQLETLYRDLLRRSATSTFVDLEGDIVWTQEYLRYRLNACDHPTAVRKGFSRRLAERACSRFVEPRRR